MELISGGFMEELVLELGLNKSQQVDVNGVLSCEVEWKGKFHVHEDTEAQKKCLSTVTTFLKAFSDFSWPYIF